MKIKSIKFERATRIYVGRDRVCRCGCKGVYYDRADQGFNIVAKNMARYMASGLEPDVGDNHVNLSYGKDRAITVYFD